jgi:hypothetical protein
MRRFALTLLATALPLSAQSWELGVFAGQQTYKSATEFGTKAEPKSQTVFAARLGYSLVDLGPALFQLNAGFQPKTEATFEVAGVDSGMKTQHQHVSLGAMFNFKAVFAVGVGLDYRFEKLNFTHATPAIDDVSYSRPWLRANAGWAAPTPGVKPFIGLEVAVPLVSKSYELGGSQADQYRAFAPKLQVGLYGGLRF